MECICHLFFLRSKMKLFCLILKWGKKYCSKKGHCWLEFTFLKESFENQRRLPFFIKRVFFSVSVLAWFLFYLFFCLLRVTDRFDHISIFWFPPIVSLIIKCVAISYRILSNFCILKRCYQRKYYKSLILKKSCQLTCFHLN